MKIFWLSMALALMGLCSLPAQSQQVLFTPTQGFSGQSHGEGSLKMLFGKPRKFQVDSFGQNQNDGTMRLDQTVTFETKPSVKRYWLIRETALLHYQGTLSDARGPVKGQTIGKKLSLRYRVRGLLVMHQTLELSPDGKTIQNSGRITFLGIPIGSLHEIIRRTDQ